MKKETRTIVYDDMLKLEAYHLEGIVQAFPNHFHEYYVFGLMEGGERYLSCKNKNYTLEKGNLVLFHPGDNHACAQKGDCPLDYRAFNIPRDTMLNLTEEITGKRELPGFSQNVIYKDDAAQYLHDLHVSVMSGSAEFDKEEDLLLLIASLIRSYGQPFSEIIPDCREEIDTVCIYMEQHYADRIDLNCLCNIALLSKSTLLRAFTKSKGVTPYRYLENIRINQAKKLLEQGATPIDAAMETGFSDQSHFSNFFTRFIGLTPGVYRDIFLSKNQKGGTGNDL